MRFAVLACSVWLGVVLLTGCGDSSFAPVAVGSKAPDFDLISLDGKTVKSHAYKGEVVVLNFWATWCANCKKELPMLQELAQHPQVKVIGIALDEGGRNAVQPFVEKNGINYTILLGNQQIFTRFNGLAIPYTLILDRNQQIVNIYRGPVGKEAIKADLKQIG